VRRPAADLTVARKLKTQPGCPPGRAMLHSLPSKLLGDHNSRRRTNLTLLVAISATLRSSRRSRKGDGTDSDRGARRFRITAEGQRAIKE
jgi:hypothetical protein